MKTLTKILTAGMLVLPALASAQLTNTESFIRRIGDLVNLAIPLVAGLALLAFFYGLMKFIFNADDPGAQKEGKDVMKWGIVALFVMVSIWGIIALIRSELGIGGNTGNPIPATFTLPQQSQA